MAFVKSGIASYFSEEVYRDFLKRKAGILNFRLRKEHKTFMDVLLSAEADFSKGETGTVIVDTLRWLEW
jgi:hypothetical protein